MVMGRPTVYDPKYCELVIELGKQGKSLVQMACAIGITKQTLLDWKKAHEEFLCAVTLATHHSQSWWEDTGQGALYAEKFQSAVYNKQIASRFRDDYADKQQIDHSGVISLSNLVENSYKPEGEKD